MILSPSNFTMPVEHRGDCAPCNWHPARVRDAELLQYGLPLLPAQAAFSRGQYVTAAPMREAIA